MSSTRIRPVTVSLAALVCVLLGAECRTTAGPSSAPVLARPIGDSPDPGVLAGWIEATETARGLAFLQPPTLEVVDDGDVRLEALRAATPLPLEQPADPVGMRPVERVAVDLARARIVAIPPIDANEVRLTLAFLLDAQHHPQLVASARLATGDVGRTLRGLLAASALATTSGGLGPVPVAPREDPFAQEMPIDIDPAHGAALGELPILAADGYLRAQRDREAAFRTPPLSSEQLLRPAEGRGSDRPVWLAGPIAAPPGCTVASDESVGVWLLARARVQRGADVLPVRGIAAWSGDRLVRWRCEGDRSPWIYIAQLDDEAGARAFATAVPELLPLELGGEPILQRRDRRVVVSDGLAAADADGIARRLRAVEVRSAEHAVALARNAS